MKKLTKSNIAFSACMLVLHIIMLAVIAYLTLAACEGDHLYQYLSDNRNNMFVLGGSFILLSLIMYFYFLFETPNILASPAKLIECFLLFYLAVVLSILVGRFVHVNARPVAFFALMAAVLFGRKTASFLTVIYTVLMFLIDTFTEITTLNMAETCASFLVTFCAGMIGIFCSKNLKSRAQCVLLTFVLLIPTELITGMLLLSSPATVEYGWNLALFAALASVFSTMLFIFILPLFEVVFSELTVFRLRELTSDDAKLIRLMKNNAMGTYNHAVTVAQMVEACAREVGEDSELARAAAFYHDVGKLKNPDMFTENQREGNPHNELTPELSVDIIRSHTRDGAMLIRKHRLPEFFAEVAVQHHGTMPIKYFYAKALKMSDREIKMEKYSYVGPTPTTKIAAIIMIADAVEAASRSLSDRSPEKVEELIRNIIEERLDMDQFDNCNITMRDLTVVRQTLLSQITGVYHTRINYPKLKITKK